MDSKHFFQLLDSVAIPPLLLKLCSRGGILGREGERAKELSPAFRGSHSKVP